MVSEYTTNCFFVSGSRVDLSEWIQVFEHLGFNSYKRTVWDPNSLKIDGKSYFRGRGWRLDRIQIQGSKAGLLLNPAYPTFDKIDGHPLAYTPAGLSNPAN